MRNLTRLSTLLIAGIVALLAMKIAFCDDHYYCLCYDIKCKQTSPVYFGFDSCTSPLLPCWTCYHEFTPDSDDDFCSHTLYPDTEPGYLIHYCQPDTLGGHDVSGEYQYYECKNMGVCDESSSYYGALTTCNGHISVICH